MLEQDVMGYHLEIMVATWGECSISWLFGSEGTVKDDWCFVYDSQIRTKCNEGTNIFFCPEISTEVYVHGLIFTTYIIDCYQDVMRNPTSIIKSVHKTNLIQRIVKITTLYIQKGLLSLTMSVCHAW